jgi:sugar lactone lactonase YvrE
LSASLFSTPRRTLNNASQISLLLALIWLTLLGTATGRSQAVGDPIPRITCPAGYQATLYASGLSSPDGLAFSPSGQLYVAEEGSGRISRIGVGGNVTPVLGGLTNPEGIAFDDIGNLYVVEDAQAGRVIKMATDGMTTTLAADRDAPEGIAWSAGGNLYFTESNAEFAPGPSEFRTRVTLLPPGGPPAVKRTDSLPRSYSGITIGPGGLLYVANEAAGVVTNEGIVTVDPATGARAVFARDLVAPEGLRFSAGGGFPLYVAEENNDAGRLRQVAADGSHTLLCDGFFSIEDVAVDGAGQLYISEDGSGSIILITPPANVTPTPTSMSTPTPTRTPTTTPTSTRTPTTTPPAGVTPAPVLLPAILKQP